MRYAQQPSGLCAQGELNERDASVTEATLPLSVAEMEGVFSTNKEKPTKKIARAFCVIQKARIKLLSPVQPHGGIVIYLVVRSLFP